MVREHETATQQHREALERYESVRDFDELARQNGRDLRQSLMQVNELENLLRSNPIAGLNKVLMQAGPRKADGQPVSLMEVAQRSEEHTSELQSLMRISYAVFCLKKKQ